MIRRLLREESGVVLPLAIIMIVLIAVMGAGLLTFVTTDLNAVVQVNQGQNAFDMADAGIKAAKKQLSDTPSTTKYNDTNSSGDDVQWSSAKGGKNVSFPDISGRSANVQIRYNSSTERFVVESLGTSGSAKRKIEATYKVTPGISSSIPAAHFAWGNITQNGGGGDCNINGTSMFAMGDASFGGSFDICSNPDQAYGKWAATSGTGPYPNSVGSYPNPYNSTPRQDSVAGIGARGKISTKGGAASEVAKGTRSFDSTTNPKVVSGSPANSGQIAFPFGVAGSPPASDLETLRQRALYLEKQNPGTDYYMDSNPGNGVNDAGLTSDQSITSWPTGSNYQTVRFYEFATSGREVGWGIKSSCSSTDTRKGVIAVENGDFTIGSNKGGFNGAIVIRGGSFSSGGGACITGYVNSGGDIDMRGGFGAGTVPPLTSLPAFQSGSVELLGWRERYE